MIFYLAFDSTDDTELENEIESSEQEIDTPEQEIEEIKEEKQYPKFNPPEP